MTLKAMIQPSHSLIIDGSDSTVFVGLLGPDGDWIATSHGHKAPLEGLFPAVETVLKQSKCSLDQIHSYIYCEGPGSVLGLRLCAMAIETWQRLFRNNSQLYAYNTLELAAHSCLNDEPDVSEALIISDWKKGVWNALYIRESQIGRIDTVKDETLEAWTGRLFHLPQRKGWQSPPPAAKTLVHDPLRLNNLHNRPSFLRPTKTVELYNSGKHAFQKWTPSRHRAPA